MSPIPTTHSHPKPKSSKPYGDKAKPKSKQTPKDRKVLSGAAPAPAVSVPAAAPVPILSPTQVAQIIGDSTVSVVDELESPFTGTMVGFIPDPVPVPPEEDDIITQAWKRAELPYPFPDEIEILDDPVPTFPKTTFTVTHLPEIPRQAPSPPTKPILSEELGKGIDYLQMKSTPRELGNKGKTIFGMKMEKFEILPDGTVHSIGPARGYVGLCKKKQLRLSDLDQQDGKRCKCDPGSGSEEPAPDPEPAEV